VTQQRRIFVGDLHDLDDRADLHVRQRRIRSLLQRAVAAGNRRAVWIDARLAHRRRHAVDEHVRRRMLEAFRFLVDLVPSISQCVDEIRFDDAMSA